MVAGSDQRPAVRELGTTDGRRRASHTGRDHRLIAAPRQHPVTGPNPLDGHGTGVRFHQRSGHETEVVVLGDRLVLQEVRVPHVADHFLQAARRPAGIDQEPVRVVGQGIGLEVDPRLPILLQVEPGLHLLNPFVPVGLVRHREREPRLSLERLLLVLVVVADNTMRPRFPSRPDLPLRPRPELIRPQVRLVHLPVAVHPPVGVDGP